jgi:diadenosine tetraphosphatase ApaH/serine/threonine PP2A family protein phosphatase
LFACRGTTLRIALLADVHANLEALEACLAHARGVGATRYVFLGDLVGYGADPERVVDVVREQAEQGAVVVQGNHDAEVAKSSRRRSENALETILWTRAVLHADAISWLGALPLMVKEDPFCFVHASAANPGRWQYVDDGETAKKSAEAAGTPWTFSGHVHRQTLFFAAARGKMSAFHPMPGNAVPIRRTRRWVAIAGSVGQPREYNPAAAYALFDTREQCITFHRVSYDHLAAARKVRKAGLPDLFRWSHA